MSTGKLICNDLVKKYGKKEILHGIDLELEYYPPWEPPVSRFRATRKFLP